MADFNMTPSTKIPGVYISSDTEIPIDDEEQPPCPDPIHRRFGLSYCEYLVFPRAILQSMPQEWQARFVGLLQELDHASEDLDQPVHYFEVKAFDESGNKIEDPYAFYDRGRRVVPLKGTP